MRTGSRRVVDKNRRIVGGKPMYYHVIKALSATAAVDEVVIDTDDERILSDAARVFPHVRLLRRPPELTTDEVQMNEVLEYLVPQVSADLYLQTHSTSPLVQASTFDRAVQVLAKGRAEHDCLVSVTRVFRRFWRPDGTPVNHDPKRLIRTQDLPPIVEENSAMYLFPRSTFEAEGGRIGRRPILFPMDPVEAWDVDNESDVLVVDALLRARSRSVPTVDHP